jgi:CRISPR-associated endonuclease/helicase Cas3
VVIFDEVHAYDTYMTAIIERLLAWLSALGTSVIILSATLPQKQRAALARAYGANLSEDSVQAKAYPSLWVLPRKGEAYHATPEAYQTERTLLLKYLHFTDEEDEAKAQWLLDAVRDGGCACWITNTVARAQAIYRCLRDPAKAQGIDLELLHARLPLAEREQREKRLAKKYGPPLRDNATTEPRERGIVIGTQVLEQSLDLDFDVMISDLAPIDLLLQRAGRLQRHQRSRPGAYAQDATLWINIPQSTDSEPDVQPDSHIYAKYLLLLTWMVLQEQGAEVRLPGDYRPLVEAVYKGDILTVDDTLRSAWEKLDRKEKDAIKQARERLIPDVTVGKAFCRNVARITFEEDETGASWVVAQTRLGRESINLIPMEKLDDNTAHLFPKGKTIDLRCAAPANTQRYLLRHHLRVSRPEIVKALKNKMDLPPLFTQSARLKGYYPLWLENGAVRFPKLWGEGEIIVTLEDDLGLVVTKLSE